MASAPTAEKVSLHEEIANLADTAFDRVQARIDQYSRDERRLSEDGTLIIKSHETVLYGPDRQNGYLTIDIANQESRVAVANLIVASRLFKKCFPPHRQEAAGQAYRNPTDWQSTAAWLQFRAGRDRFPSGNPAHRMLRGGEGEWGMKHRFGVRIMHLLSHNSLPIHEEHTFNLGMAARFDKPQPKFFHSHDVRVTIGDQEDNVSYALPNKDVYQTNYDAGFHQLEELAGFWALAKDLRPSVGTIADETRWHQKLQAMRQEAGLKPEQD